MQLRQRTRRAAPRSCGPSRHRAVAPPSPAFMLRQGRACLWCALVSPCVYACLWRVHVCGCGWNGREAHFGGAKFSLLRGVWISTALTRALSTAQVGTTLRVGGWVKTGRTANKDTFAFLELNDGTTPVNLQVCPSSARGDTLVPTPHTRLNHVALSVSFCSRCWCPQKCTRSRSSDTPGRACLLKAR